MITFQLVIERLWNKLKGWKEKNLSIAGKEVMIKAVAQALPTYAMPVFLLPEGTIKKMEMLIRRFWWSKGDQDRGLAWVAWNKIVQDRSKGGLQFKNLRNFNLAMLAKQGMRLLNNPNSLCSRVIKAKYFSNESFMNAKLGNGPSFAWRSILEGRKIIERGSRWKFGDGRTIRLKDRWIKTNPNFIPITRLADEENLYARELLDGSGTLWDRNKIESIFWPIDVEAIVQTPIPRIHALDKLIWNGTKHGIYTVKTGYELACHMENNTPEGTSMISEETYTKLWSTKVPRKNLHFIWRALHKSVPTTNNLRRRGIQVDRVCRRCLTKDEDENHWFLKCSHSKKVWDALITGNIFSSSQQYFHLWLEHQIIMSSATQRKLIFTALYSLWLARNRAVFDNIVLLPSMVSQSVINRLEELSHDSSSSLRSTAMPPRVRKGWSRPHAPFMKINFDAGFDAHSGQGSCGIVTRDFNGQVLVAGCFDFGYCSDAKFAEARAAQKAMDIVIMMGYNSIIFEGDCKVVIDEINTRRQCEVAQDYTEVEDVINGFLLGSTALSNWSILFSKRDNNSLAHYLASRRKTLVSDSLYFPPIPDWLVTLASCDVSLSDVAS